MFARVTTLEIDLVRVSMDDALARFDRHVLPRLRRQPGFRGVYVLANPDGTAALLSLWDTAEQAEVGAEDSFYAEELARFVTLFRAPPGRQSYEVLLAEVPANASVG